MRVSKGCQRRSLEKGLLIDVSLSTGDYSINSFNLAGVS